MYYVKYKRTGGGGASTGLAPDLRFDQHMAGIKGFAFVRMYGVALRPDFTVDFPPSEFPVAVELEATIARSLRGRGAECGRRCWMHRRLSVFM
jgi:hypothetical protein